MKQFLNIYYAQSTLFFDIHDECFMMYEHILHIGLLLEQLGGLVVKTLAYCTGGPRFDPRMEKQKPSAAKSQEDVV